MLQLKSFFEGHRGAVLSLAGIVEENFFYSSGSEGLIVRWQRNLPNEGQVILKITGYIATLLYDQLENKLYAAVNQKGIYIIDSGAGRILHKIDTPASSYGALENTKGFLIVTTKDGEVYLVNKTTNAISKRIDTGISTFPLITLHKNILWYTTKGKLTNLDLVSLKAKQLGLELNAEPVAVGFIGDHLLALTEQGIVSWNLKKRNKKQELIEPNVGCFKLMELNMQDSIVYAMSVTNQLYCYKLSKKGLSLIEKLQIEHNGQINSILWIENHKFVISAGVDKKIGVWQVN